MTITHFFFPDPSLDEGASGPRVQARWFGAFPGASEAVNTAGIQAAIDFVQSRGGGIVELEAGSYALGESTLGEVYGSEGEYATTSCCLVLRPKAQLVGQGRFRTTLTSDDSQNSFIFALSPNGSAVKHLGLDGVFGESGQGSGGHGIIQIATSAALEDFVCTDYTLEDLYIRDVGSYGIGIEKGTMTRVTVKDIWLYNTGADAIDTKAADGEPHSPLPVWTVTQCQMSNINAEKWAQRIANGALIDINGFWLVNGVYGIDRNRAAVGGSVGIRADGATMIPALDPGGIYNSGGEKCHISNFHIKYNGEADFSAISILTPNCVVSHGIVNGGQFGVNLSATNLYTGVQMGAHHTQISNVIVMNTYSTAFNISDDAHHSSLTNCMAIDAHDPVGGGARGFVVAADDVTLTGCNESGCDVPATVGISVQPTFQLFGRLGIYSNFMRDGAVITGDSGAGDGSTSLPVSIIFDDKSDAGVPFFDTSRIHEGLIFKSPALAGVGSGIRARFGMMYATANGSISRLVVIQAHPDIATQHISMSWFPDGGVTLGDAANAGDETFNLGASTTANQEGPGYYVNGVRMITASATGWGTPNGTATRTAFDTATVTLPQLAERVKALIDDLHVLGTKHGLLSA